MGKKNNQIFYMGIAKLDNIDFFYLETVFSFPICLLVYSLKSYKNGRRVSIQLKLLRFSFKFGW